LPRPRILALCIAFGVLCVLVGAGAFTSLDQLAVDHLMPALDPRPVESSLVDALLPVTGSDTAWDVVADLWMYPASFPLSGAILAGCAVLLRRRGRTREGVLWLAAWLVATAIEAVTKHALERPALDAAGVHLRDFDHSLPSGHTIRSLLVAAALTSLWRRGRWAWAWAASVWVLLVVEGWHTPTDVAGGLLLGGAFALAVQRARVESRAAG
jgi:membrane-associated phospholipid phosphatase